MMKLSKKSGSVAIAAALALTLAGCSASSSSGGSGKITLTYVTVNSGTILNKGEKPLIEKFEKQNPNITVKIQSIPISDYDTKLTTEFRGGGGPDVFRVNHTDVQIFSSGKFLEPLDADIKSTKIDTGTLLPGLMKIGVVDGKQMTLPLNTDVRVMFYNPKVLASKGIDSPPKTWNELLADTKAFAGSDVYGYGFPTESDYSMSYDVIGPYMKSAGGELLNTSGSKAVAADSKGTVSAVQFVQSLVKTGATVPGIGSTKGDTLTQLFSQNKLAIMLGGPYIQPTLEADNPNFKYGTDYKTAVVPVPKSGDQSASIGGGWQIGLASDSKNKAAAAKLLAFMMKPANLVANAVHESFPPTKTGLDSKPWAGDPYFDAFRTELAHASTPIPSVVRLPQVSSALENAIRPVLSNPSLPASQALETFDSSVNNGMLSK